MAALLALAALLAGSAMAEPLAKPNGPVILTISGAIRNTNAEGVAEFDRAMLEALGTEIVTTTTPWTEGRVTFEGVPATALMAAVDAQGNSVIAIALNDYATAIPISDFEDYAVLLALKLDGAYLKVRDKGPLWFIYPAERVDNTSAEIRNKMAWQVRTLRVE